MYLTTSTHTDSAVQRIRLDLLVAVAGPNLFY